MYILISIVNWFPSDNAGPLIEQEMLMDAMKIDDLLEKNIIKRVDELNLYEI